MDEWPVLECITLKVQVHPSHCGIGRLKFLTTHKRKGKSDCWSCWLSTIHAVKVGKYPFPVCEHSYIFMATSCLPDLVYIWSDVFSAFRGSLGGFGSQIHWIDTYRIHCHLHNTNELLHVAWKSMLGSKVWMERFMLYISGNLFASPINNLLSLYKLSYTDNIPVWQLRFLGKLNFWMDKVNVHVSLL